MEFNFDPKQDVPYGYWTCNSCNANFFGGGKPLHKEDCPVREKGYDSCIYNFGPEEVKEANEKGVCSLAPLTLDTLAENFPDLVDERNKGISAKERCMNR
ncbi:hypothetical protein HOE04_04090 [archaeon]|jgi:hypothetical protein|nr:hypothetical protein [archaeon]